VVTRAMHYYTRGLEGNVIAGFAQNVLWITHEDGLGDLAQTVQFFNHDADVRVFPAYDVMPYSGMSPSKDVILERLATLSAIKVAQENGKRMIVLTSIEAVMGITVSPEVFSSHVMRLGLGQSINRDTLMKQLVSLGFIRLSNASEVGEFAVRGSIIDVVPQDSSCGYRIDFLGNAIESIKKYDLATQRTFDNSQNVELMPCSELVLTPEVLLEGLNNLTRKFGLAARTWAEVFEANRTAQGQEAFLGLFYGVESNLLRYLGHEYLILHHSDLEQRLQRNYQYICDKAASIGTVKDVALALEVEAYCTSPNEFMDRVKEYTTVVLDNFHAERNSKIFDKTALLQLGDAPSRLEYIASLNKQYGKIVIGCYSFAVEQKVLEMLQNLGLACTHISHVEELKAGLIAVAELPLAQSLEVEKGVLFISEVDLFGRKATRKHEVRSTGVSVFNDLASFACGELVVHKEHGIGEFAGIESLNVLGVIRDFVKLIYAAGDRLFIPVENLDLLSKYGADGGMAQLDKLGALAWQTRKSKLKKRIKMAAQELLKIAAKRQLAKAPAYECDVGLYEEFCNAFGHIETPDQLSAFEDVQTDMGKEVPMDRLICGDVGFGKTEVALRAAFLAVCSSQKAQVVVLVPTTLLARQHYATFSKRFEPFGVRVQQLSKFTPRKDVLQIKKDLAAGNVDIVIGTHALLAKDIQFFNVGLIIIDEEQHFGVKQKERLREMRSDTHVLTLSATPIPRTLHLAVSGIKDLSIIATPPVERLPIKTFALVGSISAIKDAITREIERNGRVFYITPRVAYLDDIVQTLKQTMPGLKVCQAHGGMSSAQLDGIMNKFYDGEYNVLVCTTIVESGLDIPSANTIIVERAHMFGLAQLYQIRGRVGRSNVQSYAYLTYPDDTLLQQVARQRLEILTSYDSLGAGFSIANHDMDIRGYGNLVGEEQSGCIKEVGVELYQSMLQNAIEELQNAVKQSDVGVQTNVIDDWSPVLNLKVSVQIPESFVEDMDVRLGLYRRIAAAQSVDVIEELELELIDRFGALPGSVKHLLQVVKLKLLAKIAGVSKVDVVEKGLVLHFFKAQPAFPEKVLDFIAANSLVAKLKEGYKMLVVVELQDAAMTLSTTEKIIRQISV
jgi:transcription-repair coupling factor (superfamily II helicase)